MKGRPCDKPHLDQNSHAVLFGSSAGLLGADGQLLLFEALRSGPAYLVFPIIQLLNSIGALCLVFALRFGKAIIVVPMAALEPGMVLMLEPGIYFPKEAAVRLEDAELVTADGAEVLTKHDKEM